MRRDRVRNRRLASALAGALLLCAAAGVAGEAPAGDTVVGDAVRGAGPAAGDAATERFQAYLDGVMAAQFRDYALVGATFALVRDGRLVLSRGYGASSLETGEPVDPARTLFRPGSVSKLFTWTAVMQLVEQGGLDLNAPLSGYVTQFELPEAFGVPLTMTHVMTHTPGLEDGAAGFLFADEASDLVPLAESLAAHIPTQVRPPGTYAAYSNWATALAGLVVANISGMPFEDYVEARILEPLGMSYATFREPLPENLAPYMAQGYRSEYGGVGPMGFEFIANFGPAGALSASAEDMARFIIAHVSGGAAGEGRILQPETAALMHSRLFAHDPRVAGMAYGFYEIFRNGQRFVGHDGATIAFHSRLVIEPRSGFGFFLSFNAPDGARALAGVADSVLDYFYPGDGGANPVIPEEPLEGSAERIAQVAGAYRFNRRAYTTLEGVLGLAGDLVVVPGPPGEILVPAEGIGGRFAEVAPYEFRKQGRQLTVVFERDDQGGVSRALIGPLPVMVADRLAFWEAAGNHQLVIAVALLAAFFVLLNAVRNRGRVRMAGWARLGRWSQLGAAASFLLFPLGLGLVFAGKEIGDLLFEFPPPGTGLVLVLPVLGALLTLASIGALVPVWRSAGCNTWQRLRYTFVSLVFLLLVGVLAYWNLLGWRY